MPQISFLLILKNIYIIQMFNRLLVKTQFGKDIDVAKLREDTLLHPDSVAYNKDHNVMVYKKEYPFNKSNQILRLVA